MVEFPCAQWAWRTHSAFRLLCARPDLRLHRKIAVFDRVIAYTGSLNLTDPRDFKQKAGVGQWVDALVSVEGPAVGALSITFETDWALETGQALNWDDSPKSLCPPLPDGSARVQVLPTGPDGRVEAIGQVVLMAIYTNIAFSTLTH